MAAIENGRLVRVRRWFYAAIGGALVWLTFCANERTAPPQPAGQCECS